MKNIGKQANDVWNDIINSTRNGPVKIIPPPEGYIPPKKRRSYSKKRRFIPKDTIL